MTKIDLVFQGGGAKGAVFVGALEELFRSGTYTSGRLLGTSAGAITAVVLAAGLSPSEMLHAIMETDPEGKSELGKFLGVPAIPASYTLANSELWRQITSLGAPPTPEILAKPLDDMLTRLISSSALARHTLSFMEFGGWYSADHFLSWLRKLLDTGFANGKPRRYGHLTLREFHDETGIDVTLVASDTSWRRMLLLNHKTAPNLPVIWATRMSMSIPFLWQEVSWKREWGPYYGWNSATQGLEPIDVEGHTIVDGGLLSNFPIALLFSDRKDSQAIVGPLNSKFVLGLLIDDTLPVPDSPPPSSKSQFFSGLLNMRFVKRIMDIGLTAISGHDNMSVTVFEKYIVRLPAKGYDVTQFDMSDEARNALVVAGGRAMAKYLSGLPQVEELGKNRPARPVLPNIDKRTVSVANASVADLFSV